MKTIQQNSDFLYIGQKLLRWYSQNARILPWRTAQNPYNVWISEIILQQTRVEQGLEYYINFTNRFKDISRQGRYKRGSPLLERAGILFQSD